MNAGRVFTHNLDGDNAEKTDLPQRHRDTEATRKKSLCRLSALCVLRGEKRIAKAIARFTSIVVVCLALLSNGFALQDKAQRNAAEILDYASQLAGLIGDGIWQGFDARRYAFVNTAADAAGFSMGFSDAPLNPSQRTLLMTYDLRGYDLEDAVALAFHESFHVFESDKARAGAKWRRENSMLVSAYPETDARLGALFHIEGRLLYDALRASDERAIRKLVQQFIALRRVRHGEMESRFVEFEKGAESNEGLAEYAGAKAVLLGIRAARNKQVTIPFKHEDERGYLESKYAKLQTVTDAGKNSRLRFYYTGSAQAFLLDRLLPDWKRRVQFDGAAVQDLLAEAAGYADDARQTLAEAAMKQYGYAAILKSEEANAATKQARKQALLDGVLNQKGRRFVIDFSGVGHLDKRMGRTKFFDPMNITVVSEQVRVHTRMLHIGEDGSYSGEFEQAVVEDFERKQYITVVDSGESQIIADGERLNITQPVEKMFTKKLIIKTPKFTFEASSGIVAISEAAVMVRLR